MAARRNAGTQTSGVNILYNVYGVMRVFSEQIEQSNLGNMLLMLNSLGIDDRAHLPFEFSTSRNTRHGFRTLFCSWSS